MRAKSEIFSVSPKTFRTKVRTFYNKEEKKIVNALYGPHLGYAVGVTRAKGCQFKSSS